MARCKCIERTRWVIGVWLAFWLTGCGEWSERRGGTHAQLTLITQPEGAQVLLGGTSRGIAPLTLEGLRAGPHLLEIRRTGYRPAFMTVNLFEGQRKLREIRLEPIHALVLVESYPPGAEVLIGDSYRGQTPLLVHDLRPGNYRFRLQAEGYFPRELTVTLEGRTPQLVMAELLSDSAVLQVGSEPPGATVRVDGASYGETPVRIERVRTGEVLVELLLDGFLTYQQTMRLRTGQEARLDAALIPLPSGLSVVTTPPGARVYLNDQYRGESPLSLTDLAVGAYTVRVRHRGYAEQQRSLELGSGDRHVEDFQLVRTSGTLIVVTEPAGVEVRLGGERVGVTEAAGESDVISNPLTIDYVPEGSHVLQLTRAGYAWRPRTISMEVDQTRSLHLRMDRRFIPDTRIRTGTRAGEVFTGVFIQEHPNGDIELETRPGIRVTLSAEDIQSIEPLQAP